MATVSYARIHRLLNADSHFAIIDFITFDQLETAFVNLKAKGYHVLHGGEKCEIMKHLLEGDAKPNELRIVRCGRNDLFDEGTVERSALHHMSPLFAFATLSSCQTSPEDQPSTMRLLKVMLDNFSGFFREDQITTLSLQFTNFPDALREYREIRSQDRKNQGKISSYTEDSVSRKTLLRLVPIPAHLLEPVLDYFSQKEFVKNQQLWNQITGLLNPSTKGLLRQGSCRCNHCNFYGQQFCQYTKLVSRRTGFIPSSLHLCGVYFLFSVNGELIGYWGRSFDGVDRQSHRLANILKGKYLDSISKQFRGNQGLFPRTMFRTRFIFTESDEQRQAAIENLMIGAYAAVTCNERIDDARFDLHRLPVTDLTLSKQ